MKAYWMAFIDGCPRSMLDASKLLTYLQQNGWTRTDNMAEAQLIFLSGCGFSQYAEDKSLNFLTVSCRNKPEGAKIVVFGCLTGTSPESLQAFDVTPITSANIDQLDDLIGASIKLKDIADANLMDKTLEQFTQVYGLPYRVYVNSKLSLKFITRPLFHFLLSKPEPVDSRYNKVFNIRVAKGCNATCTYCAIKFAAGPVRSKPLDKIVAEFQKGLNEGYSVFRFVAEDVGGYGQDLGLSIVDLLEAICALKGDFQLIWDDFNPNWLIKYFPQLLAIFKENASKFGYMGFPIQSGSERVLKLMGRGYTAEDTKTCLTALTEALPDLVLTTHFIVGFPGETDADLEDTINLGKAFDFKNITVYKYDDRPHTAASKFQNKIPLLTRYRRLLHTKKAFKKKCLAYS
jgi:tRNA A37 methylthiotransferase MiaB